jgi:prepilin signal peptidase PulO-like enzyme (type II secretory pathway)
VLFVFIAPAALGILGAVIMLAISRHARESHQIPFGPFLAAAAVIALLFGDSLIRMYLDHVLQI